MRESGGLAKERRREGRTQVALPCLGLLEPSVNVSLHNRNADFYVHSVTRVVEGG